MKLSSYSQGRNNNFNLIRIVAALAVLITHSYSIAGFDKLEPFKYSLGMTPGSVAVDVFFLASGFLVTSSLLNRQSTIDFIWARVLRIFPALLVMMFLTVFALGPIFTALPISEYFASSDAYIYLLKGSTLLSGVVYTLPGVFNNIPMEKIINGSLWSLPAEVRLYTILVILWIVLRLIPSAQMRIFKIMIGIFALSFAMVTLAGHFYFPNDKHLELARVSFMFFTGASFYILKERIQLLSWAFWLFFICLLLSTFNRDVFFVLYIFTLAYILFYVAYVPSGYVRKYNQVGDYSYGVYIYAFPVQQSVAALMPGVSILQMSIISTVVTLLLAAISWHLIEHRALGYKAHYIHHTRRILGTVSLKRRNIPNAW